MKKLLALLVCLILSTNTIYAATSSTNQTIKNAIIKYKKGDYVGCIQDMDEIVKKDPSNALSFYYIALSFAQLGNTQNATFFYNTVLKLNTSSQLKAYAQEGLKKISPAPAAETETKNVNNSLPKVPTAPSQNAPTPAPAQVPQIPEAAANAANAALNAVNGGAAGTGGTTINDINLFIQQQRLNQIKDTLNQNKKIDPTLIDKANSNPKKSDNSELIDNLISENTSKKKLEEHSVETKISVVPSKPSAEDIVKAMQILKNAGFEYTKPQVQNQTQTATKTDNKMMEMMLMMSQMNSPNQFMGNSSGNQMNNMLPLMMMSQDSDALKKMDPKMLQMMMSSMITPDLSMFSANDKN